MKNKAYLVLNLHEIKHLLRCARAVAKEQLIGDSSCLILRDIEILPKRLDLETGERQICSTSISLAASKAKQKCVNK